jgi:hypothetical protein
MCVGRVLCTRTGRSCATLSPFRALGALVLVNAHLGHYSLRGNLDRVHTLTLLL